MCNEKAASAAQAWGSGPELHTKSRDTYCRLLPPAAEHSTSGGGGSQTSSAPAQHPEPLRVLSHRTQDPEPLGTGQQQTIARADGRAGLRVNTP